MPRMMEMDRPRRRGLTALLGASVLGCAAGPVAAQVQPHAGMLRYPDVSDSHIVFSYANDLWIASRDGGEARPLASPPGSEGFPRFSADGKTVAFVGNYEGDTDLYTIPVAGGVAQRVTHHPAGETLCDWTPDGGLIFYTNGLSGLGRAPKLFTVDDEGGLPEALPVPYGAVGAISPDGEWLAYTPHTRDSRTWKRYRGGMATDIWLFNLKDNTSKRITDWEGTDSQPMWRGSKVYYLSDQGPQERLNIWSYDTKTERREQITKFDEFDCKWPAIGPGPRGKGEIILQNGTDLVLVDLGTKRTKTVKVTIPGDRPTIRPQSINASRYVNAWDISSTGKRATLEARGDIWTLPAENGSPRNLTRTDTAAERTPAWSPDGRWIAYMSDETGEYELYVTQSDGKGDTRQLTETGGPYKWAPSWTPDSETIVFQDKTGEIFAVNVESGELTSIDVEPWANRPSLSFSHDSRWMAYDKADYDNGMTSIWLYNFETGEKHRVTSTMFNDGSPAFDRKGDWLYFTSARRFSPEYSAIDTTFVYTDAGMLLAVPLRADVENPWLPEIDEETWKDDDEEKDDEAEDGEGDDEGDADEGDDAGDDGAAAGDPVSGVWQGSAEVPEAGPLEFTLTLTLEGTRVTGTLSSMMFTGDLEGTWDAGSSTLELTLTMPDGPAVLMNLTIDGDRMSGTGEADGVAVGISAERTGDGDDDAGDEEGEDNGDAKKGKKKDKPVEIDLEGFEERAMMIPVAPGAFGNLMVNNKNQLLYARRGAGGGIKLFDMQDDSKAEKAVTAGFGFAMSADGKKILVPRGRGGAIGNASAGASPKSVSMDGMMVRVDPRDEWRQMYWDVWRTFRDFFYVENMHGVDWEAMGEHYAAMVDDCATREDLNFVIGELIAELNVGHAYRGGGDVEGGPNMPVGLLGCDFELSDGAYRISRIYTGGVWDADARGPLSQPGVDVNEGDYLLAVNGIPVDTDHDPWRALIGAAGRPTTLTVSEAPEMNDDAREVVIEPLRSESNLRYRAWIEAKRKYVDEKSDGRVGYIYVPNTGVNGQNDLFRQFYGQQHKAALIIDERWNGGGQIPTRFIELLNRPRTNYWARRDGKDWAWPPDSHQGPKCMLINGLAGSGGDMFPWLFKQNGLGPLIGTRTWGGLVGISGNPGPIDNGFVRVPTFGFYETDGTWGIEGHGVDPDIEVIDDPAKMVDGGDPQLDVAIEVMLEAIRNGGYEPADRPDDPVRTGIGIADDDK